MKKVMIIALIVAAHAADAASMKGSKTMKAATATSGKKVMPMALVETAKNNPWHERYCNALIALRGMAHNHPKLLETLVQKKSVLSIHASSMCPVARELLAMGENYCYAQEVAQSLKETPLNTLAACDGTTCRALIDDTKKYPIEDCRGCERAHGCTEYCHCECHIRGTDINPTHTSAACSKYGQKARLRIDELVAKELAGRKSKAAAKK